MTGSNHDDDDDAAAVPFYLMPVAAVLGMYVVVGSVKCLYLAHAKYVKKTPTKASSLVTWGATVVVAAILYAKVVALVNNAMEDSNYALFDPFELLEIQEGSNTTVIKQAYRSLSKLHHPDKGGSSHLFHQVHLAYKALTDPVGKANYEQYGHPEGPPSHSTLAFALPSWLLHPEGNIAVVLVTLYLAMLVAIVVVAIRVMNTSKVVEEEVDRTKNDAEYMATYLTPDTTHMDLLYMICTTPGNIQASQASLDLAEVEKLKRHQQAQTIEKKKLRGDFELDDQGWADDHDEDDDDQVKQAALKAKQLEEEKDKEKKALEAAQGKPTVVLEGTDDGVIGQEWVQTVLRQEAKAWPPSDMGWLDGKTFSYQGKQVSAMEHPAIRRNLCMTTGRLYSIHLNSHTDLLEAGSKGLIDQTYFKPTVEFRQRTAMLLEAALKVATSIRSYRLAKTIVETHTMFKIGTTSPNNIEWFQGVVMKQYGVIPKLEVTELNVHTEDEDEIATNDTCTAEMNVARLHAENFTKQKIAQCQKQGIPPQLGLQTYREGWWIMIRGKKLDGGSIPATSQIEYPDKILMDLLNNVDLDKFSGEKQEKHLLTAWPMMVQNVAQKSGKIKLKFKAPTVPGKYRFYITIMSQDFLGSDMELTCDRDIVDEASVTVREDKNQDELEEDESKKEK